MTAMQADHFKSLAKMCGVWAIARKMCKEGYPIELALRILACK